MLLINHGQMSLAKSLENREDRVKKAYQDITVGPQDLQKKSFVEQRLEPVGRPNWDVYSGFFFKSTLAFDSDGRTVSLPSHGRGEYLGSMRGLLGYLSPLFNQYSVETI